MFKLFAAILACLALSACFESRTPVISRQELAQPGDLEGAFWLDSLEESTDPPGVGNFSSSDDGYFTLQTNETESYLDKFRMVEIIPPNLYLMIADQDNDLSYYFLMERKEMGIWQESLIATFGDNAFSGANLAYAQSIAARHGLTLDGSDPDKIRIDGPIDGMAIPSLFRDRAFLAALTVKPVRNYLPGPRWPVSPAPQDDVAVSAYPSIQFLMDAKLLAGAEWVQPPWLAGEYRIAYMNSATARSADVTVRQLADGRFEATYESGTSRFGLLPLDPDDEVYVAVCDYTWSDVERPRYGLYLEIIRKRDDGYKSEMVLVRGLSNQPGHIDLIHQPMQSALTGKDLTMDRNVLSGSLNAGDLLSLLNDGRFTIGLETTDDGSRYLRVH